MLAISQRAPLAAAAFPRSRLRILDEHALVVEDDADLEPVLRRVLHAVDPVLRLDWATSVGEAVRLLQDRRYALVVADYLLGNETGTVLRRWLERHSPHVPFAMISALPLSSELMRPDGTRVPFLPKPFSVRDLYRFLAHVREGGA